MLDVGGVYVYYPGCAQAALNGVSLSVPRGALSGLVGESGSGKSTLVTAALGLLPAGSRACGEIVFEGRNILALSEEELRRLRWKKIALVPQGAQNSFTPVLTIGAHFMEVLKLHCGLTGREAERAAAALLEETGLDASAARRYPHELSGGQKQRAAIALALACSPSLLLADEPTTALDVITQAGILKLLRRLQQERGLTVLLVTHDLPMAASVCSELFVMYRGQCVEHGSPAAILSRPVHAHTQALVKSALRSADAEGGTQ
ncbi:MAG: ABC transporter ATP-binding protein [Pyramidobacter sp.]|nr:ABC transporter ATP-binding protein [Pyramidobacter sp.]